jgi:hypothetical protein
MKADENMEMFMTTKRCFECIPHRFILLQCKANALRDFIKLSYAQRSLTGRTKGISNKKIHSAFNDSMTAIFFSTIVTLSRN